MFQKKTLSMAIAVAAAFGAVLPATAQDEQVEEVVVTGIRASLTQALDVKRTNTQIVDAIVSEDIGKFPDNNVIEAMQRITGVQVTNRASGEVAAISIRGLTDINTTINGRNIFTASGLSVALQDVPASLIKQVDVYKTRSASQIENGIAGSVDIKTQRPFDFEGSKFVLAARAVNQDQADKTDPVISGLASNRWSTGAGEFGALVNLSFAETNYRDQSVTAGAMVPFATDNPVAPFTNYERIFLTHESSPGVLDVAENPIWTPGLLNGLSSAPGSTVNVNGQPMEYLLGRDAIFASDFNGQRERTAANVSFQFAPNDNSEYLFEAFYNGYRNESFNSLLFSFADWWGAYRDNPTAANIQLYEGTNIVKSRSVNNQYMFTSGDLATGQTDSYVYALSGNWDIGSNVKVKSELVYQDSEFSSDFVGMRFDKVGHQIDVDFNSGGGLPAFNFPNNPATAGINENDLTDLVAWNSAQFYDTGNRNDGDATTFTTDLTYTPEANIFTAFDFGVRIDNRTAAEARRLMRNTAGAPIDNGYNGTIPIESINGLASINSGFFDGNSDVPTSWAVADGHYLKRNLNDVRAMYGVSKAPLIEDFNVEELTTSAYATAKFESELAGKTIDGEIGLRYTGSETDVQFGNTPSSSDTSKVLPSLMVRYHWTDSLESRFAYTETLRRPAFNQLNGNIILSPDITNIGYGTARGGNADLAPTESQNYDFSLEWYFADSSSLYGTLFKREIEGFVIDFRRQVQLADANGVVGTYVLNQPFNASNGELSGLELGAVWFPENLPSVLDGFGIQASYTALDSSQSTPVTNAAGDIIETKETDLFGVSDESYSVVLAYDKNNLGVRLSYAWRSEFLNNYEAALFANPIEIWRKPESSLDLQVTYDVNDNLSLTLDGTNLTEEIYQSYYGENGARTNNFGSSIYSRTLAIGARLTF